MYTLPIILLIIFAAMVFCVVFSSFSKHAEIIMQFIGIVTGVLIIIVQLGRQHRNSLNLQKENMKDRLRLEIYKDLAQKISEAGHALNITLTKITSLPTKLETQQYLKYACRFEPIPIEDRAETISQLHFSAGTCIISLVITMEKYEIAIPNFTSFKRTFCDQSEKFDTVFSSFYKEVLFFLPIDVPQDKIEKLGTKVITSERPNQEKIEKMKELANKYLKEVIILHNYLRDLSIAAQNHLIGSLFNHKLPPRKPTDPNLIVLTTDKEEKTKQEESK